jgi:hypothetical protein
VFRRVYGSDSPDTPKDHVSININLGRAGDDEKVINP